MVFSGTTSYTDTDLDDGQGAPLELIRQTKVGNALTTARYWYVLDGRGDVVALTDSSGSVVDRYAYGVWGSLVSSSEAVPQRLRYAGYWYDQELNWYWVGVRYYSPSLKRWLQPDPSQIDGVRTYVYVGDDPVDASDPSGLCPATAKYGPCVGKHTDIEGDTIEYYFTPRWPPFRHERGRIYWSLLLAPKAQALGPLVTVTMPLADVNGRPISPPYSPHTKVPTYDFHSSMRVYTYLGRGGGTHSLKLGDTLEMLWLVTGINGKGLVASACEITQLSV